MLLIDKPMPESCEECPCYDDVYNHCNGADIAVDKDIWWKHVKRRMDYCPLYEADTEDDLISRQAAIDALNEVDDGASISTAITVIEGMPSAQPEIIRCKDCKHFAGEGMYCACDIIVHYDHFYCYHAEREESR